MQTSWLCSFLAFLLATGSLCEGAELQDAGLRQAELMNIYMRRRNGAAGDPFNTLLPITRWGRAKRPNTVAHKLSPRGSRFALSLDVPTSILSVLIDLARNQDMHAKAAANAELMARIGKRK